MIRYFIIRRFPAPVSSRNGKYMSKSQLKMSNPQLNLIRKKIRISF